MDISISVKTILDSVNVVDVEGEANIGSVSGVATLKEAQPGDLSFLSSAKFMEDLEKTKASIILISKDIEAKPRRNQLFFRVESASLELARICEIVAEGMWSKPAAGVHRTAIISPQAMVDRSASIGPFVIIEAGARIGSQTVIESHCRIGPEVSMGAGCRLSPNVVVERDTSIGDRVRVHAGVVIGADGFGYEFFEGAHRKIPQIGYVKIGNDVEIGANTTIDRGRLGPTVIGEGTKIDNQVQVGHNVVTGKHCILCAQVGLAGSTTLGDYVVLGGRAGASGHLEIGSGAQLSGECVAYSDLEPGKKYGGSPAIPLVAYQRVAVITRRLPDLFKRLQRVEKAMLQDSN